MTDYKRMYTELFNAMTQAIDILKNAQQRAENIYINTTETFYEFDDVSNGVYVDDYELMKH